MTFAQPLGQMIVELGLDDTNFARGMKGVNQQLKTSMTEMKAHLNVMGKSGSEIDKLKARQTGLSSVIEAQSKKVELAKDKYEECKKAVEGNSEATQAQKDALIDAKNEYTKAIGELGSYQNQLKDVENQLKTMESSMYKVGDALESVGSKMTAIGDGMAKSGKTLTKTVTAPIIALGTLAVKAAADFESSMSEVEALSGAAGAELQALTDKAKEMGKTTIFSASEAAGGLKYMALAGWETEEMLAGIEPVLKLAGAANEDLGTTSDIVTDALTALGMSAEETARFTDVLAKTMSNSNTDVSQMGEAFKYAAPLAGSYGYSIEELGVALGIMANQGIKGSQAGTTLKNILSRMADPTSEVKKAMEELGVSMFNSDGSAKDLSEVMDTLRSSTQNLTDKEKAHYAVTLAGKNAQSGFLAILNTTEEDYNDLTSAISNSTGATNALYDTMQNNLSGQLTILKSSAEAVAISFGDVMMPVIKDLTSLLQKAADWINNLTEEQKKLIVKIVGVAAAVGPVLLIVGKLTKSVGGLLTGVGKVLKTSAGVITKLKSTTTAVSGVSSAVGEATTNTGGFTSLLGKIASPVGIAVAATAAIAAIGVALYTMHKKAIQNKIDEKFGNIKLSAEEVEDVAKRLTKNPWTVKIDAYMDAKSKLAEFESGIEESLETINKLDWKVSVGLDLTEEEKQSYKDSVTSYVKSVNDYIEQRHYVASLALEVTLDTNSATYASLSSFTNSFYSGTQSKLNELGQQLADAINQSFEDGTFSEDNPDIKAIRKKMDQAIQKLADEDFQARLTKFSVGLGVDVLSLDYDSFKDLNDKIGKEIDAYMDSADEAVTTTIKQIQYQYDANIAAGMSKKVAKEISDKAYQDMQTELSTNKTELILGGFSFALGEIDAKYKDDIDKVYDDTVNEINKTLSKFSNTDYNVADLWENLQYQLKGASATVSGDAKEVTENAFKAMEPSQKQLIGLAKQYINAGQKVPESLLKGLSDISKKGAAVNQIDSMFLVLGKQIASSPQKMESLKIAFDAGQDIPEELVSAIEMYSGKVYNAATGTFSQVTNASNDLQQDIIEQLNKLGWDANNELAQALAEGYHLVYNAESGVWEAIEDVAETKGGEIKDTLEKQTEDSSKAIVGKLEEYNPLIKNSAEKNMKAIEDKMNIGSVPSRTWGEDLMSGMESGIAGKIGNLSGVASRAAKAISDFLHFSRPDKGPLRDYEKWMPDFMSGLAGGIKSNQYKVADEANALAGTLKDTLTLDTLSGDMNIGINAIPNLSALDLTVVAPVPEIAPILTSKTRVIELLDNALRSLEADESQNDGESESAEAIEMMSKLVDMNSKMILLLQQIADKRLIVDEESIVTVSDRGQGHNIEKERRGLA